MNEIKKISPKNLLGKYLASSIKKSRNSIILNTNNIINNENNLIISRDLSKKNKAIKINSKSNRIFKKIKSSLNTKSHKDIKKERIYLRLEQKDEIEKIIKEEEKKRFFNQEFHLNKNINREELKRRIGNKIPFDMISNKTLRNQRCLLTDKKKLYSTLMKNKKFRFKRSRNIEPKSFLNIKSSDNNDIENTKKNYDLVEEFLDKMDEERIRKYNEIEKNFMKHLSYENILYITKQNDNNNIDKKIENLKLKESDFIKFKRKQMIKEKKYLKQKSRIFDNILKYDFNEYNSLKNEESKFQIVNYQLLSRTILMRNLIKQMKVAVIKDENLNVLRGFQSLKVADLENKKYKFNQDIYENQSDNTFYLGYNLNNLKNKPIPHFLKLKFNMKTTKKFGEIIGSYFGLPV